MLPCRGRLGLPFCCDYSQCSFPHAVLAGTLVSAHGTHSPAALREAGSLRNPGVLPGTCLDTFASVFIKTRVQIGRSLLFVQVVGHLPDDCAVGPRAVRTQYFCLCAGTRGATAGGLKALGQLTRAWFRLPAWPPSREGRDTEVQTIGCCILCALLSGTSFCS